jgi:hypothetical protein
MLERLEDRLVMSSPRDVLIALEATLNASINHGNGYSMSSNSATLAWNESYVLSSYVAMYHATGSTAYLDSFVTQANRVLANASDVFATGFLGWATTRYSTDGSLAEYLVHDGMIATPMARFAYDVQTTPSLRANYGAAANRYVNFIQTNILPKWEPYYQMIDDTSGTYVIPMDNSTVIPGNSVPYNWDAAIGSVFLWLYAADGNPVYEARAAQLATTFKNNLQFNGSAYVWDYADPLLPNDSTVDQSVEDASHANQEVSFAILAYQMGIVFTSADMQYFTNTLTQIMWNHSISSPMVSMFVSGFGGPAYTQFLGQWTALASVDNSTNAYQIWSIATAIFQQRHLWLTGYKSEEMLTIAHLIDILPQSGQLLYNGSFENPGPTSADLPYGWIRNQSTTGTAFRENTLVASGKWALAIRTAPAHGAQIVQQPLYYLPNAPITVTFNGCTNGSAAGGRMQVYDYTTRKVLADIDFTNTDWQQYSVTFNTPIGAGHDIELRLYQINWKVKGGVTYFDDVTATQ